MTKRKVKKIYSPFKIPKKVPIRYQFNFDLFQGEKHKKMILEPKYHKQSKDKCEITFYKRYIEICATVDGTGNTFHLPYGLIKGVE